MSYFVTCTHEQRILNGTSSDTSLCHWGTWKKKFSQTSQISQIWPDLARSGTSGKIFFSKKKNFFSRSGQIWAAQIWRSGQIWQHPWIKLRNFFFFYVFPPHTFFFLKTSLCQDTPTMLVIFFFFSFVSHRCNFVFYTFFFFLAFSPPIDSHNICCTYGIHTPRDGVRCPHTIKKRK